MFVITFSDIAKIIGGTAIVMIILFCLLIWWLSRKSEDDNENTCKNVVDKSDDMAFKCSVCGVHLHEWVDFDYNDDGSTVASRFDFKYCPNCGREVK